MKRFEVGDLVVIKKHSPIFSLINYPTSFGIIKAGARLLYVHDWETDDVIKEFWAYDVIVEGHTYENVPEETLSKLEGKK